MNTSKGQQIYSDFIQWLALLYEAIIRKQIEASLLTILRCDLQKTIERTDAELERREREGQL